MVDSKMTSTNRILNISRQVMEIVLQCIIFVELALIVVLGIANRPVSDIWLAFLILPFVLIDYYSRKYIKNLVLFVIINFGAAIGAGMLGKNDLENVFFFLCIAILGAYSMTIKLAMIKKSDYIAYAPQELDITSESLDEHNMALMSGEKVHFAFGVIIIAGYMIGSAAGKNSLMLLSVFLFVSFVLMQVAYNQISELNDLFRENIGKSEFPTNRIININAIIILMVSVMMIIAMVLFYNGRYGNIFTIIGGLLLGIVKLILRALLFIMKNHFPDEEPVEEPVNVPSGNGDGIGIGNDEAIDNTLMSNIFLALGITLMIAVIAALIFVIIKYANKFKNSRDDDNDEIEYLKDTKRTEIKAKRVQEKKLAKEMPLNSQYRRLYKKRALSDRLKKPDESMMPEQITTGFIVEDLDKAQKITASYEKARYSGKDISKDELDYLKKL